MKIEFTERQIEILKDTVEYMLCDKLDHYEFVKNNTDIYIGETPNEIYNELKVLKNIKNKLRRGK